MDKQRIRTILKFNLVLFFCAFYVGGSVHDLLAWSWKEKPLVVINGQEYSAEDYKNWWRYWQEKDMAVPESPDSFIDWQLIVMEAKSMELENEPSFRRKINTFLKARTLLLYKDETIDQKVVITEADIRERYEKEYLPRWYVAVLHFMDKDRADQAYAGLVNGDYKLSDLDEETKPKWSPKYGEKKWFRGNKVSGEWLETLDGMQVGDFTAPTSFDKGFVVLQLLDKKGFEESDLEKNRKKISKSLWDNQQDKYTMELIGKLKKDYHVQINEEILAQITPENTPENLMDEIVLRTDRAIVDVKFLLSQFQRDKRFRSNPDITEEELTALKNKILNDILAQSLTSWAALDRHYEKEEPFKFAYEFYRGHRLNKEYERLFITPASKVNEEEIAAYYQENIEHFSEPVKVRIAMIEDDEELINRLWLAVSNGEDFFEAGIKLLSYEIPVKEVPLSHTESLLREELSKLATGEVSKPIAKGDSQAFLVKLLRHIPSKPRPLDEVKQSLVPLLKKEKRITVRNSHLRELKARSTITVNKKIWRTLEKELVEMNGGEKV